MHDSQLEDRLRTTLRTEGDGLPLTITAAELERRLAIRQRQSRGRVLSLIAAVIAFVAVAAIAAMSNGWLRLPAVGATASPTPTETPSMSVGPSATPAAGETEPPPSCTTVDPSTMTEGIDILLESSSDTSRGYVGNASVYRMGDRSSGTRGRFADDDALNEPMMVPSPASTLLVSGASYAGCVVSLEADAVPVGHLDAVPLPLSTGVAIAPTDTASFSPPPTGSWVVRVLAGFETTNGHAWSQVFFNVDVGGPSDTPEPTLVSPPTSTPH